MEKNMKKIMKRNTQKYGKKYDKHIKVVFLA